MMPMAVVAAEDMEMGTEAMEAVVVMTKTADMVTVVTVMDMEMEAMVAAVTTTVDIAKGVKVVH